MATFSQLVDDIKTETRRPDMVAEIARYCNQTIRELHFDSQNNAVLFFGDNWKELQLTASVENGFGWDMPDPAVFQKLHTVKYVDQWDNGSQVYPKPTTPGRHLKGLTWYYYQMAQQFVFAGYGGIGSKIDVGWYEYPKRLIYKTAADRLVTWDAESLEWIYDPSLTTDEQKAAALANESNWLLTRWEDVIAEGMRAKVFKARGDTERARTSYSLFMSLRQGFWTSEVAKVQEVL